MRIYIYIYTLKLMSNTFHFITAQTEFFTKIRLLHDILCFILTIFQILTPQTFNEF